MWTLPPDGKANTCEGKDRWLPGPPSATAGPPAGWSVPPSPAVQTLSKHQPHFHLLEAPCTKFHALGGRGAEFLSLAWTLAQNRTPRGMSGTLCSLLPACSLILTAQLAAP